MRDDLTVKKPQDIMLIVNPFSGRGLSKSALGIIVSKLCEGGRVVTVFFAGVNTPGQLAFMHARDFEMVVCAGGDGTLSSVVSGLLRSGASIPVGYIPAGTANDVATSLALSKDPNAAALTILEGTPRPLDIGRFGSEYFTYVAAFGVFTGVAYLTPLSAKRALGQFAYVLGGLADVATIRPMHTVIEYDDGTIEGDFIFGGVVNSTSVAGLVKFDHNDVDLADGVFEIILVRQPVGLADFLDITTSIATQSYDGDNIQLIHSSKATFILEDEVAWTVDGENGGLHKRVEIANCHKAVDIIVASG